MTAWLLTVAILLMLALPGLLRCTVRAAFRQGSFSLELYLLGFRVSLPDKSTPGNNIPEKGAPLERERRPDLLRMARMAELAVKLFSRAVGKMRVERLKVHVLSAFPEPYDTAMVYSLAGLSMQTVMLLAGDRIRELDLRSDLDFEGQRPVLNAAVHASLRLGRLAALGLAALYGRRKILRACRKGCFAAAKGDRRAHGRRFGTDSEHGGCQHHGGFAHNNAGRDHRDTGEPDELWLCLRGRG